MKSTKTHTSGKREKESGVFKTAEKVDRVVNPTVREVVDLARLRSDPMPDWAPDKLHAWMSWLEAGSRVDARTPLWNKAPRGKILDGFTSIVTKSRDAFSSADIPGFREVFLSIENEQREKVGPMSMFKPWTEDGPEKVDKIYSDKRMSDHLNWNAMEKALSDVANLLPSGSIHPTTLADALHGWKGRASTALDTSTNSCYPTWVKRWYNVNNATREQQQAFAIISERAKRFIDRTQRSRSYKDNAITVVATVAQRTNVMKGPDPLNSPKLKRPVIALPKDLNTVPGKTVMTPIQESLRRVVNPYTKVPIILGWQPLAQLDKGVNEVLRFADSRGLKMLSGDISNFDASLPPELMWAVALAISKWLDKEAAKLFLTIIHADIYGCYLITPNKVYEPQASSLKSGSIFTSLMGCMVNYCIQRYGHHAGYYNILQSCVMGDDFIACGEGLDPESMEKTFADVNMECNAEKQMYEAGICHFLQRLYELDVPGGVVSAFRTLGKSLSTADDIKLEKGDSVTWAFCFKWLTQVNNCVFNPWFESLAKYIAAGDSMTHLGAGVVASTIPKLAGGYADRYIQAAKVKPWKYGDTMNFDSWPVNGAIRGERLPPRGFERYRRAYGVKYEDVPLISDIRM